MSYLLAAPESLAAAATDVNGIAAAMHNPEAHVTAQDWAAVLEVAKKNAQAAGVADRLELLPGSAFDRDRCQSGQCSAGGKQEESEDKECRAEDTQA